MGRSGNTRYRFGSYTLDPAERRISGEGDCRIELTAKAFDLLVLLVSRAGKLVTKDEILDEVWQGDSIAESNITTTISMIRKALQEDSERQYIETIPKKGYRFVADVCPEVDPAPAVGENPPVPYPQHEALRSRFVLIGFAALLLIVGIAGRVWYSRHLAANAPETPYSRAIRLETEGDDTQALATLNELVVAQPGFDEARLRAAWLEYQADNDEKAQGYLDFLANPKVLQDSSAKDSGTRLKAEGLRMLLDGKVDDALSKFQLVDPADIDALIYIADVAIDHDNFHIADDALAKCLKRARLNPFCGFERIEVLTHEQHFDAAIAEDQFLTKSGVKYPWLDYPSGYAELANDHVSTALGHFESLEKAGRDFHSAIHFRASQEGIAAVNVYQGKLRDALVKLNHALDASGNGYASAAYYLQMAKMDAFLGKRGEAQKELQNVPRTSKSGELVIPLAEAFAIAGDFTAAQDVLQQNRDVATGDSQSYAAAKQFVEGVRSLERQDVPVAIRQLKSSYDDDPNPETAYFTAKAQMQQGDWQSAIQSFNLVLENKGTVVLDSVASLIPLTEYNLSICYGKLGQNTESDKHFLAASTMWANADPDVKATLTRLSASPQHR